VRGWGPAGVARHVINTQLPQTLNPKPQTWSESDSADSDGAGVGPGARRPPAVARHVIDTHVKSRVLSSMASYDVVTNTLFLYVDHIL